MVQEPQKQKLEACEKHRCPSPFLCNSIVHGRSAIRCATACPTIVHDGVMLPEVHGGRQLYRADQRLSLPSSLKSTT